MAGGTKRVARRSRFAGLPPALQVRLDARRTYSDFVAWVQRHSAARWAFRGHASSRWSLKPSIGRVKDYGADTEVLVFEEFKRMAPAFSSTDRLASDWEWLALAQHHGLPTRLLDWTTNPLVAAYFASAPSPKTDAEIVAVNVSEVGCLTADDLQHEDPFRIGDTYFMRPPAIVGRIVAQRGLFSVHHAPERAWRRTNGVDRFTIPKGHKAEFRRVLFSMGIDSCALMADLDGLSATLRWRLEDKAVRL